MLGRVKGASASIRQLKVGRQHGKGYIFSFHLAVLCDSLRCGAYGTFCYGISWNVIIHVRGWGPKEGGGG